MNINVLPLGFKPPEGKDFIYLISFTVDLSELYLTHKCVCVDIYCYYYIILLSFYFPIGSFWQITLLISNYLLT